MMKMSCPYHSCSARLPLNSEAYKEWMNYKDNMKTTVEQYKVSGLMGIK